MLVFWRVIYYCRISTWILHHGLDWSSCVGAFFVFRTLNILISSSKTLLTSLEFKTLKSQNHRQTRPHRIFSLCNECQNALGTKLSHSEKEKFYRVLLQKVMVENLKMAAFSIPPAAYLYSTDCNLCHQTMPLVTA